MNEKKLNFTPLNNLGFTLVELIISILIGSFIILGISGSLMNLYENISEIDDGISITSAKDEFKRDVVYIKKYYPHLIYMTGGIYSNNKYGFNAMIFEDIQGDSAILLGVTDGDQILIGFQNTYKDAHIFYKKIDKIAKNSLINSFNTNYDTTDSYIYKSIYPIKFTLLFINNLWKIDIISSGIYYKNKKGKNINDVGNDDGILWYNISFLIP